MARLNEFGDWELTIAERVAQGVAILDAKRPGWDKDIDLDRFEMTSEEDGILGQLFGDDNTAAVALDIPPYPPQCDDLHDYMFWPADDDDYDATEAQTAWVAVIQGRR